MEESHSNAVLFARRACPGYTHSTLVGSTSAHHVGETVTLRDTATFFDTTRLLSTSPERDACVGASGRSVVFSLRLRTEERGTGEASPSTRPASAKRAREPPSQPQYENACEQKDESAAQPKKAVRRAWPFARKPSAPASVVYDAAIREARDSALRALPPIVVDDAMWALAQRSITRLGTVRSSVDDGSCEVVQRIALSLNHSQVVNRETGRGIQPSSFPPVVLLARMAGGVAIPHYHFANLVGNGRIPDGMLTTNADALSVVKSRSTKVVLANTELHLVLGIVAEKTETL